VKLTNRSNLPASIVDAIKADPYSKGGSDWSVTQLIDPPQLRRLMRDHYDDVTEDVSDRIWALYGQSVHAILERAGRPGDVVEQRFYMPTEYGVVSGQIDHYSTETETLSDWKVTSVYKVKRSLQEPPHEWVKQLNMQAQLMRHAGIYPMALQIVAICRDWQKGAALREKDYPARAVTIPIPLWPESDVHEYIEERARLHYSVMFRNADVPCTDEERWKREDQFAVMRKGKKRALRLLDSKEEVKQYLIDNDLATVQDNRYVINDDITIETRPGAYVRCAEYCPVSTVCPQYDRLGEQ